MNHIDRIEQLRAELARVTAERDEAKSEADSALDTCARTLDERDALRARVAEVEEQAERYRLVTLRQDAAINELQNMELKRTAEREDIAGQRKVSEDERNALRIATSTLRARVAELAATIAELELDRQALFERSVKLGDNNAELVAALRDAQEVLNEYAEDGTHRAARLASERIDKAIARAESSTPKSDPNSSEIRTSGSAAPVRHPDGEAEIIGEYAGKNGRRDWWSGGVWLRPGQFIAIIDAASNQEAAQWQPTPRAS